MTPFLLLHSRRWLEYLLLVAGLFCLTSGLWQFSRYQLFEHTPGTLSALPKSVLPCPLKILGRLEVPRLALSVAILEGETDDNLALGAAHLSGTAPLGGNGNSAIAGHRDLAFRSLRNIQPGDEIIIKSATDLSYRVSCTRIVNPADTSVLGSDGRPRLTLITCYPFYFVGPAPRRFIVEAELQKRPSGSL